MISNPESPTMLRRIGVALGGLSLVGSALLLFGQSLPARAGSDDVKVAVETSRKLLAQGNATAARAHALKAIAADPDSAAAHAQLATALLALGEGMAAEGEVERAITSGMKPAALAAARARAQLLQGDPKQALATVGGADTAHRVDALRVRGLALARLDDLAGARNALERAVTLAPKSAGAWTDLGRFRYIAGDLVGAIAASARAVAIDSTQADTLVLRGELVRQQYGLAASLPWFETALKRDPWHHDALIETAATLGDMGRTREMLNATRRAMQARPGSVRGFYLQAVLAARADKFDLARTIMARISDQRIYDMPGALMLSGVLDLKAGAFERAADKLGSLVGDQPLNLPARKLFATALARMNASKNAISILRPVVMRSDADSYSLELVARALERIDAREEAGQYLDRAQFPGQATANVFSSDEGLAELTSDARDTPTGDPATAIPLIRGLIADGQADAALERAERVAAANPGAPASQILVGDVLMAIDRPGPAAAAYHNAADIRFDEPVMLRLVDALDQSGQSRESARALALFLSQNPDNVAALRLAAHRQVEAGDPDAAIDTLEGLRLRLGNRDAATLAELAFAYASAGDDDRAVSYGEAAYALQPLNPLVVDSYGWALLQSGDARGAVQLMQKATAIAPRHPVLRWHLALAYAEAGAKRSAKALVTALLADPAFDQKAAARTLYANLG